MTRRSRSKGLYPADVAPAGKEKPGTSKMPAERFRALGGIQITDDTRRTALANLIEWGDTDLIEVLGLDQIGNQRTSPEMSVLEVDII